MNGINDNKLAVEELINLYKDKQLLDSELRILRYNEATNGVSESLELQSIIKTLEDNIPKLKVQHSSGNSVASACGMFIVQEAS
jgi:adenine C2-methylase RlmN of 23S rRNA A2503 and tRNA A37